MDYSDTDGYKAMVARKLTELELSRNDMIKILDIALLMSIEQLEKIENSLSKNQRKTKFGKAISVIIEIKKDYLWPHPPQVSWVSPSTEKELPHPQLFPALGFSILNPLIKPSSL